MKLVNIPRPTPRYATDVPREFRHPTFKTHPTVPFVRQSLVSGPWFLPDDEQNRYNGDGTFRCDIVVYALDTHQDEYVPRITIKAGTRKSAYALFTSALP